MYKSKGLGMQSLSWQDFKSIFNKLFVFGKGSRWEEKKIKEVMKQMDEDK